MVIGCLIFYGSVVVISIFIKSRNKDDQDQEQEEHDLDKTEDSTFITSNNFCIPDKPRGSGFALFIEWVLYLHSLTTAFIPYLTLFWCDPSKKRWSKFWPLAIVFGGLWVTGKNTFYLEA